MKILAAFSILLIFLFLQCTEESADQKTEIPVFENAVTLELRFGDDDVSLPDEFLVARPKAIGVNNTNEIMVLDEDKIKVFDQNGSALRIVGGHGQGPGEFENGYQLHVSPTDFVSVKNIYSISLYNPKLEFVHKKSFTSSDYYQQLKQDNNWQTCMALYAVYSNENERVIFIRGSKYLNNVSAMAEEFKIIVHEKNEVSNILQEFTQDYNSTFIISSEKSWFSMGNSFEFFGDLLWAMLPGGKIAYIDTGKDFYKTESAGYYNLSVLNIDTNIRETIERSYNLILIDDDKLPEKSPGQMNEIEGFNKATFDKFIKNIYEFRDKKVHCAPLQALKADGKYLFAFTYKTNENDEIFTDVFDMDSMEHISSTYFPKVPRVINNGKAYNIEREDEDSFITITKYSIAPEVYGITNQ